MLRAFDLLFRVGIVFYGNVVVVLTDALLGFLCGMFRLLMIFCSFI